MLTKKTTATSKKSKPVAKVSKSAVKAMKAVAKSTKPVTKATKSPSKVSRSVSKSTKPAAKKSAATAKSAKPVVKKSKLVEIKTKPTAVSVTDYINTLDDEQQRKDSLEIIQMMQKATGDQPVLWGSAIIGFGNIRYKSPATGREVDWLKIGFAPRKGNISLYLTMDINAHADTLKKLGKHKTGKGCLYINKLSDVDVKVLKGLMETSLKKRGH